MGSESRHNFTPFIIFFRILTVVIASVLYLWETKAPFGSAVYLVTLIVTTSLVISIFYLFQLKESQIRVLVAIEMIGYTIILVLTGGMLSPYFLLILNPMLSALQSLKSTKLMKGLASYFGILMICLLIYTRNINQLIGQNSILIFSYLMIMLISFFFIYDVRSLKIHKVNLEKNNAQLTDSLEVQRFLNQQFMKSVELLDILELVSSQKDLLEELTLYLLKSLEGSRGFYLVNGELVSDSIKFSEFAFLEQVEINNNEFEKLIIGEDVESEQFLYMNLNSDGDCITFCILKPSFNECEYELITSQFQYVIRLFKMTLNRFRMARVKNQMIIKEEQKRIAEEMHDQVNQKLFAISCLAHQIIEALKIGEVKDAEYLMEGLYQHLKTVNQEIRNIVYQLSDHRQNTSNLHTFLTDFLAELEELYGIKIELELTDELVSLPLSVKQLLIRILNESISNAVRHGKAELIQIKLTKSDDYVRLNIIDNGTGFELLKLNRENKGLGLDNMMRLAAVYGGVFEINSAPNRGTEIVVHIKIYNEGGRLIG